MAVVRKPVAIAKSRRENKKIKGEKMDKEKEIICILTRDEHCDCRESPRYGSGRSCKLPDKAPYASCMYQITASVIVKKDAPAIQEQPASVQHPQPESLPCDDIPGWAKPSGESNGK